MGRWRTRNSLDANWLARRGDDCKTGRDGIESYNDDIQVLANLVDVAVNVLLELWGWLCITH